MNLATLSASSAELISLEEMKAYLRVDDATQDGLITQLVKAAGRKFQEHTGRQLLTATYKLTLQKFPCGGRAIRLPMPPFVSVTSFIYLDTAGDSQTLADDSYQVALGEQFANLTPLAGSWWPDTQLDLANAVQITYQAGYGDSATNLDPDILHALKVLVAHWYENRESADVPDFWVNLISDWNTGEWV